MSLIKHDTWSIFQGTETHESFRKNILQPIFLKPEVNEEIKNQISLIEKLLDFSYYEYEFIDIAILHTIFTLEKAMSIRLNELNIPFKENRTLKNLSKWFYENNYFELENLGVIDQLRDIRNGKVHNEKKSFGGSIYLSKLYRGLDLINDMYEDLDLRGKRKSELNNIKKELKRLFQEGAIIEANEKRLIIYSIAVIFLNNKLTSPVLHLAVWPIFDPQPYLEGKHYVPDSLLFRLKDLRITDDHFKATDDITGKEVVITRIDEKNSGKLNDWSHTMNNLPDKFSVWNLDTFALNDYFYTAIREFHQMGA